MQGEKSIEGNNERIQLKQDVLFIRLFLEQMSQTRVMRWREEGDEPFLSAGEVKEMNETDASHTGQMHVLATNILDKALAEKDTAFDDFDVMLMLRMIQLHDLEESITGDVRVKDTAHYKKEEDAISEIKEKASRLNYGEKIAEALDAYRARSKKEARFVKAIDELQAWFYVIHTRRFDAAKYRKFTDPDTIRGYVYAKDFPTLFRIMKILLRVMQNPELLKSAVPEMELIKEQYQ